MGKHGAGSFRRRGDSVQLVVSLPRDPLTGGRRQLTRTVRPKPGTAISDTQARRQLAAFVAEAALGGPPANATRTVAELLDKWFPIHRKRLSPSTAYQWEHLIARHIRPHLGLVRVVELTPETLDRLYDLLGRGELGDRPLAAQTVRHVHTVVRAALDRARRWGWITMNPAKDAEPPKLPKRRPQAPPVEVVRLILDLARDRHPAFYAYVRLAAVVGSRRGETLALRRSDVDLGPAPSVRLWHAVVAPGGGAQDVARTKTEDDEVLALDAGTAEVLRGLIERQDKRAAEAGVVVSGDAYLFSRLPDCSTPWHPSSATRMFVALRREAGVDERVQLRHLRNFMVTEGLRATRDLELTSRRARHAKVEMTAKGYAAERRPQDAELAEALGRLLDG